MRKNILLTASFLILSIIVFSAAPQSQGKPNQGTKKTADTLQVLFDNSTKKVLMPDGSYKIIIDPSNQKEATKSDTTQGGMIMLGKPSVTNQNTNNPNNPPELSRGIKKAKKGDFLGAIASFDSCIVKNDKNHNAYFHKAKALLELKQPDSAIKNLDLAIENNLNNINYYFYRGRIYFDKADYLKAYNDFDMSVILKPDFTEGLNYRGVTRALTGNHTQAIIDYEAAIKLNPKYAIAFYNKGTSEAALEKYEDAVASFSKCVELDSTRAMSFMNRGNCYVMLKKYEMATIDYSKAIELDPQNPNGYVNRGTALYYSGDLKACDDWQKAESMGNKRATELLSEYCK